MSLLQNCTEIAFKFLSNVEIDNYGSNQHELHGAMAFKQIFGMQRQCLNGTIYYIDNSQTPPASTSTTLTWYDAREFANNNRSEYRFYYDCSISSFKPSIGDILLLSKTITNNVIIVIINNQNIKNQIMQNIGLFTSYPYPNGTSYYASINLVPFLTKLI